MSLPKIVHQIHLGGDMSCQVRQWVESIACWNLSWSHIIWDEGMLRAVGLYDIDALRAKCGHSWASITNLIRLQIIERFGGVYLDTDFECIESLAPLLKYEAFTAAQDGEGASTRYCNAAFGARAGHPWIRYQIELANDYACADAAWGVYAMTAAMHNTAKASGVTAIPPQWVYSWRWDSPPHERVRHKDALALHHWQKSW